MKYLLDTVTFLWMFFGEKYKLSDEARQVVERDDSELHLSIVSAWEIAIKYSKGKLKLVKNPADCLPELIHQMGLKQVAISLSHALSVSSLPHHHRDPFDRLLAAQARAENLPIITPDPIFKKYRVKVVW